jgi:hypothetical protein
MPTLPLFIADYDPSLSRAIICFTFMVLEKYQNFAVLVRNVGYVCSVFVVDIAISPLSSPLPVIFLILTDSVVSFLINGLRLCLTGVMGYQ